MYIHSALLSAFAAPILLLLRDCTQAGANALEAGRTSVSESTPDYRRMYLDSPSALDPTSSVTKLRVSEMDTAMRDSEGRIENELAGLVDFVVHELMDVAKNTERFGLKEKLAETVTRPISTAIDVRAVQRTKEFREFARGEKPMDAQALADLLKRNNLRLSKLTPEQADKVIDALLFFRKPAEVVKVLLSLRRIGGMTPRADMLHRRLAAYYKNFPGLMSGAWMRSGIDPKRLVEILGWRSGRPVGDEMLPVVSELFRYVGEFGRAHPKAVDNEGMFRVMFPRHSSAGIDASIRVMSETIGYKAIANKLRELYSDVKTVASAKHVDTVAISSREEIIRSTDFRLQKFVRFAISEKPMDAAVFRAMLENNFGDRIPTHMYVEPADILSILVKYRPAADVAQLLVSFPLTRSQKERIIQLHKLLVELKPTPGLMSHVWMESGLHPMVLFRHLIVDWYTPVDPVYLRCVAEWFRYIRMFGEKHPDAFSTHDAAILLFHNKPPENVELGIRMVEEYYHDKPLAQMLRQMHQGVVREELAKASNALHAKAIRDSPSKPSVRM